MTVFPQQTLDGPVEQVFEQISLPYSEVCMHLRIAGKTMSVGMIRTPSNRLVAQIFDGLGKPYSFPILPGEAGIQTEWDKILKREHSPRPHSILDQRSQEVPARVGDSLKVASCLIKIKGAYHDPELGWTYILSSPDPCREMPDFMLASLIRNNKSVRLVPGGER